MQIRKTSGLTELLCRRLMHPRFLVGLVTLQSLISRCSGPRGDQIDRSRDNFVSH